MKRYVFVVVSCLLFITACRTVPAPITYTLPPDLPAPSLYNTANPEEIERDYVILVVQDIRWRLKMNLARWIVGEISDAEYQEREDNLNAALRAASGG